MGIFENEPRFDAQKRMLDFQTSVTAVLILQRVAVYSLPKLNLKFLTTVSKNVLHKILSKFYSTFYN